MPSPHPFPELIDRSPAAGHPPSLQPQLEAGSWAGPGPRGMKVRRRSYTLQGSTLLGSHSETWESARLDLSRPHLGRWGVAIPGGSP